MSKTKDYNEKLRNLSSEELDLEFENLKKQLFELRNQDKLEKNIEKPHLLKRVKRDTARVFTIRKEKETQQQPA